MITLGFQYSQDKYKEAVHRRENQNGRNMRHALLSSNQGHANENSHFHTHQIGKNLNVGGKVNSGGSVSWYCLENN